ncbi:hypothetical protein DRH14_02290 [Candidatus Shapirobacteria bacterium]|nr:MAG: hypothetical protein DRH14_02290 [Candidatus Shapirobacteria bacterium]
MVKKTNISPSDNFFDFLKKNNILAMAIGVVIADSTKELISSIVNNLIMPFIAIFTPQASWRQMSFILFKSQFKIGQLLGSFLDFIIISFILYLIMKKLLKLNQTSIKVKK